MGTCTFNLPYLIGWVHLIFLSSFFEAHCCIKKNPAKSENDLHILLSKKNNEYLFIRSFSFFLYLLQVTETRSTAILFCSCLFKMLMMHALIGPMYVIMGLNGAIICHNGSIICKNGAIMGQSYIIMGPLYVIIGP